MQVGYDNINYYVVDIDNVFNFVVGNYDYVNDDNVRSGKHW